MSTLKDTTTATSTNALTLVGGASTFASLLAIGSTIAEVCVQDTFGNWEIGSYVLTDAKTLTRQSIKSSSNAGQPVTFPAGTKTVVATVSESSVLPVPHLNANPPAAASGLVDPLGNPIKIGGGGGNTPLAIGSGSRLVTSAQSFAMSTTGAVGRVVDVQHAAVADFEAVRLVFLNFDTTAVMTINAAKVAAAQSNLQGNSLAGGGLSWSDAVTFGGNPVGTVPQAAVGAGGAGMPNTIPGVLISDWVAVDSLPRNDGGVAPLLRTRAHMNDGSMPSWQTFASQNADGNGLLQALKGVTAAASALTTAVAAMQTGTDYCNPVGVIYAYKSASSSASQIKSIAAFGDSLTNAGSPTTVSQIGWVSRITYDWWNQGGPIFSAMNFSENGQTLEDSHSIMRAYCAAHQPNYAAFYAFSPNSVGRTAANFLTRWAMVMNSIDFLIGKGIKPVLMTSTPVESYSQPEKDEITKQNNRIKSLSDRVMVVDGASIVSDGSVFYPQYRYDVTHYNDAGHKAIGAQAYKQLSAA